MSIHYSYSYVRIQQRIRYTFVHTTHSTCTSYSFSRLLQSESAFEVKVLRLLLLSDLDVQEADQFTVRVKLEDYLHVKH